MLTALQLPLDFVGKGLEMFVVKMLPQFTILRDVNLEVWPRAGAVFYTETLWHGLTVKPACCAGVFQVAFLLVEPRKLHLCG